MDFLRHKLLEWTTKNKRATFGSTFRPFQSVELSLHWLLPSRAKVRFTQQAKCNEYTIFLPTDTVYRIDPNSTVMVTDCIAVDGKRKRMALAWSWMVWSSSRSNPQRLFGGINRSGIDGHSAGRA